MESSSATIDENIGTKICPVCNGRKCLFTKSYMSDFCHRYDPEEKDCVCSWCCMYCRGRGYIEWIDSLFNNPDNYPEEVINFIQLENRLKLDVKLNRLYTEHLKELGNNG